MNHFQSQDPTEKKKKKAYFNDNKNWLKRSFWERFHFFFFLIVKLKVEFCENKIKITEEKKQ